MRDKKKLAKFNKVEAKEGRTQHRRGQRVKIKETERRESEKIEQVTAEVSLNMQ